MNEINYIVGDATEPIIKNGLRLIAHVVNNKGGFGSGFVAALNKKWKEPRDRYVEWVRSGYHFGDIQIVSVIPPKEEGKLAVVNMMAQNGYISASNPTPFSIGALHGCLNILNNWIKCWTYAQEKIQAPKSAPQITAHLPRIGMGLGGWKNWKAVENELKRLNCEVYVYNLPK